MLCVQLKGYTRACAPTTGGVSRAWTFDPTDFDWTQGSSVNSYASVALHSGATAPGAAMFPINFLFEEGQFKATQKQTGCSTSWDYEITLSLPDMSQNLSDFMDSLASAACCCGLGVVIEFNNGKVFVVGERYVGGNAIPRWQMKLDGATLDSGKQYTDYQGGIVVLKGSYSRSPREFTGGGAAIEALQPTP